MKRVRAVFAIVFVFLASIGVWAADNYSVNLIAAGNSAVSTGVTAGMLPQGNIYITQPPNGSELSARVNEPLSVAIDTTSSSAYIHPEIALSNGSSMQISISPAAAVAIGSEAMHISSCSPSNGCTVYLTQTEYNQTTLVIYQIKLEKDARLLGIFRQKMTTEADIDAQTGAVIAVMKPWWAGFAIESSD